MTAHTPIRTACRLLRQAAKEYAEGVSINGVPQWGDEPETYAAWLQHITAARALEEALVHDLEGVQRDDTEHGITYYTAADLAVTKERAYTHGRIDGERAARAYQPSTQEPAAPADETANSQNAQLANIYRWIIHHGSRALAIIDNWHFSVPAPSAYLHEALARAALGRRADIPNIDDRQAAAEGPAA